MELKIGAMALSVASLLFLLLAVLTGGIVFYAAFAAAMAAFAIDFYRYASARSGLTHKLRVDKRLSRTDTLLGSSLTVILWPRIRGPQDDPAAMPSASRPATGGKKRHRND